jgi:SAM-dependent methyltransferase
MENTAGIYKTQSEQGSRIRRAGRFLLQRFYDRRGEEHAFALAQMHDCKSILDVACGGGRFLEMAAGRAEGVDLNPDNVIFCQSRGLRVTMGDAMALPYADASFDGVHSSHVMQVFTPAQAVQYVRELFRVCKSGGKVTVVVLCGLKHFWIHPENVRPYPPVAFLNIFPHRWNDKDADLSPMWADFPPPPEVLALRLRRPALIQFDSATSLKARRIASVLNALQYGLFLRKYWTYDAYTMVMRKR